jgi:hypothetical protein
MFALVKALDRDWVMEMMRQDYQRRIHMVKDLLIVIVNHWLFGEKFRDHLGSF